MSRHKTGCCVGCGKQIDKRAKRCKSCAQKELNNTDGKNCLEMTAISLYNDILKAVGKGRNWLYNKFKKYGVDNRKGHTYVFDDTVFDIENSNKYYLLGLFATDGHIGKNRNSKYISICLNKKDEVLLNDIRKVFKTKKPLYLGTDNCLSFTLYSEKLYDRLVDYGITERKSLSLRLEKEIPAEFRADFLRGCFDGDGSISCSSGTPSICFCCGVSKIFMEQLREMYVSLGFDVRLVVSAINRSHPIYILTRGGRPGLLVLCSLYSCQGLFLPRKYLLFLKCSRMTLDETMMEMAHIIAMRSTCLRAKVGCIITNQNRTNVISIGYNGGVRGRENHCESIFPGECGCLHAELNALIKQSGPILYCTMIPCTNCAKMIINAGVSEVYYSSEYRLTWALQLFRKSGIKCHRISRDSYLWKTTVVPMMSYAEVAKALGAEMINVYPQLPRESPRKRKI